MYSIIFSCYCCRWFIVKVINWELNYFDNNFVILKTNWTEKSCLDREFVSWSISLWIRWSMIKLSFRSLIILYSNVDWRNDKNWGIVMWWLCMANIWSANIATNISIWLLKPIIKYFIIILFLLLRWYGESLSNICYSSTSCRWSFISGCRRSWNLTQLDWKSCYKQKLGTFLVGLI
jgi:hypothetical protein